MGLSNTKQTNKIRITAQDKAILEVKIQRDRLKQYQKKIKFVTERETEIAKEQLKRGNKQLALLALKKRNYQNSLLEKTHDQLWNLEQLVQSIEFAQVESRVFSGLKAGNEILKELQAEIKIEDVEQLMEDTAEAVAYQQEVSQLLAGADSSLIADEDALLEELEGFIAEQENDEIILPSVPKTKVSIVEREELVVDSEEEIRRVGELVAE